MKKLTSMISMAVAMLVASTTFAQMIIPAPVPDAHFQSATAVPAAPGEVVISDGTYYGEQVYCDQCTQPLFTKVKYVDKHEMHPCAIEKIIQVKNPCLKRRGNDCCEPECVFIKICVPPCECSEDICCRRKGTRINYSYNDCHSVDVRIKNGFIVVDYQKSRR